MQKAIEAGQYTIAEQARLEGYAFFELELFTRAEGLFWYGSGSHQGLADLINSRGVPVDIASTRVALDGAMHEAEVAVGSGSKDRATIITITAIIVIREGLEAVLILAALMASFKGVERRMRRPMWLGVGAALVASAATWAIAQTVLTSLAGYGEKLSAVVSLVAIGMLLLILNWFFHKTYWTGHLASLHGKKKLAVGDGRMALTQVAALALLGFTSVYREGFETVLFMQALVLATDVWTVFLGVLAGLSATALVGLVVFNLERRLPYKKMLMLTGSMVTWVLVVWSARPSRSCRRSAGSRSRRSRGCGCRTGLASGSAPSRPGRASCCSFPRSSSWSAATCCSRCFGPAAGTGCGPEARRRCGSSGCPPESA